MNASTLDFAVTSSAAIRSIAVRLGARGEERLERIQQEVFVGCWRREQPLSEIRNPNQWLKTVVRRATAKVYRDDRSRLESLPLYADATASPRGCVVGDPASDLIKAERAAIVAKSIGRLPSHERSIAQVLMTGERLVDYANGTSTSYESCRTRQKRLRRRLARDPELQALCNLNSP